MVVRVLAEEWQFTIADAAGGDLVVEATGGLIFSESGRLSVVTGQWGGPVEVTGVVLDAPPAIGEQWTAVEEVTVECRGGLRVETLDSDPVSVITNRPGRYRVRVSARGRQDGRERESVGPRARPIEHYLIEAWPTVGNEPPALLRAEPEPHDEPVHLDHETAGQEAAARLYADVVGTLDARQLSGQTGTATAGREFPYTRRKLFKYFENLRLWLADAGGLIVETGEEVIYSGILPGYGDWRIAVRHRVLDVHAPAHIRREWNWFLPPTTGDPAITFWTPVLPTPTELSFTLNQVGPRADPITTVTVVHADIPIEWVDDITAFWTWKLEYAHKEMKIGTY